MTASRRWAVAEAGHTGNEAAARSALADRDPVVRATALGALERLGALTGLDLETAFADGDSGVRRRAAQIAAAHPAVSLLGVLDDPDAGVVEMAAWACGERPGDREVVARLSGLATGHGDALVREAAAAALGALGDPDGLPAILAATRDKPAVRRRAVLALAPFEGPDVDAALERARQDRDWQVRQGAEDLLDG